MPPSFKDLKSLNAYLQEKIDSALENEVAQTVKEVEQENIEESVYDAYTPRLYKRRGSFGGGLGDIHNMKSQLVESGVLEVRNRTPPNPNYNHSALTSPFIDKAVEFGREYDFLNPGARRYTEATVEELENSNKLSDALKEGLQRQGIKSKQRRKVDVL